MALKDYVHAMPKVELRIRLEGAYRKDTLLLIAEQNDIAANTKKFDEWVALLDEPDSQRVDELLSTLSGWLRHSDDISRLVYDLGVTLAKENVRYAEVLLNPALHMLPDMTFDRFLDAVNDGRDRAERGWGIRINWILNIPRNEPRRADETIRWAASAAGKRAGISGIVLTGKDDAQPVGQFERAFTNARKKVVPTAAFAGDPKGAESVQEVLSVLEPDRLVDGWGVHESPELIGQLAESGRPLDICLSRIEKLGWINAIEDFPLRRLYDENVKLVLSSDMPSVYQSSLPDEYAVAVERCGLSIDELEEIALNAITFSFLPEEEKATLRDEFVQEYKRLRDEHLTQETPESQ